MNMCVLLTTEYIPSYVLARLYKVNRLSMNDEIALNPLHCVQFYHSIFLSRRMYPLSLPPLPEYALDLRPKMEIFTHHHLPCSKGVCCLFSNETIMRLNFPIRDVFYQPLELS